MPSNTGGTNRAAWQFGNQLLGYPTEDPFFASAASGCIPGMVDVTKN